MDLADFFFLTPEQQLDYYQKAGELLYTHTIKTGVHKYPLKNTLKDFRGFRFTYKDTARTINDFIKQTNVVGLIIIRNDSILLEQYAHGVQPGTKWISFSVTKSVTSLLFGIALKEGFIHSMQDKVTRYLPELRGGVYDSVSLHHLLQMASGVKWIDNVNDPESDLFRIGSIQKKYGWKAALDSVAHLKRAAAPGTKFNYNTIETILASMLLKRVTGKPLSQYLSEKIWKPFGMQQYANWVTNEAMNLENGGGGLSASLRDYALLGLFTLQNGKGSPLPGDWMKKSTQPSAAYEGYGYYWWLRPGGKRYFAAGSFGQQVEIDPLNKTIIAIMSYWPVAFDEYYESYADTFIEAMMKEVNGEK
jgi:CubicO group peptidase (beta-lactamase class C family)